MLISHIPRLKLAQLPTPLYKLERLTEILGGPTIYIKRDDLTGLGLGGNKIRKLEFLLADAKEKGADVVLTTGGIQSNHCMLTAMAARKVGMRAILVLRGKKPVTLMGNLVLSNLVSEIIFVDHIDQKRVDEVMKQKAKEIEENGEKPYIIPVGGSVPLGALGYYAAFDEIIKQAESMDIKPTHIVFAWGSGGTHGGLVAAAVEKCDVKIVGINVDHKITVPEIKHLTAKLATDVLALIGNNNEVDSEDIKVMGEYVGEEGYGSPSRAGMEAIKTLAQTEGIILDPVYSGKAMAGLLDLVKQGFFSKNDQVIFLHTGGSGSIFAFPDSYLSIGIR